MNKLNCFYPVVSTSISHPLIRIICLIITAVLKDERELGITIVSQAQWEIVDRWEIKALQEP